MRNTFLSAVFLLLLNPMVAMGFDATETQRIKELVMETLRENPEILLELSGLIKEKHAQQRTATLKEAISLNAKSLFEDENAPVAGNVNGDVTMIEFFDYNCGYCKKSALEVQQLLDSDGKIKIIYREWPVLSEDSVFGAKAALAARKQGMYLEMHHALMALPRVHQASTLAAAKTLGLDIARLQKDMTAPEIEQHLRRSVTLAQGLGFTGTPSMIIGNDVALGYLPLSALQSRIQRARAAQ